MQQIRHQQLGSDRCFQTAEIVGRFLMQHLPGMKEASKRPCLTAEGKEAPARYLYPNQGASPMRLTCSSMQSIRAAWTSPDELPSLSHPATILMEVSARPYLPGPRKDCLILSCMYAARLFADKQMGLCLSLTGRSSEQRATRKSSPAKREGNIGATKRFVPYFEHSEL